MRTAVKYGVAEDFISMVLDGSGFYQYCTPILHSNCTPLFFRVFCKEKKDNKNGCIY